MIVIQVIAVFDRGTCDFFSFVLSLFIFLSFSLFTFCAEHVSLGALGDSFYEYLLKAWLQTNKADTVAREKFDEAIEVSCQVVGERSSFSVVSNGYRKRETIHA